MKIRLAGLRLSMLYLAGMGVMAHAAPLEEEHGPAWLNEHGAQTTKWVAERNARTLTTLRADPRFAFFETAAADILTDPGRLAPVTVMGDYVYQYWQTRDRPLGEWRRTPHAAYLSGTPAWQTVLDVQALATAEKAKFIFAGAFCLEQRCLIHLSRNGKDADEQREFDLATLKFVKNGFHVPESKSETWWYDADTLIVAPALARAEMDEALLPRTLQVWRRGTPLSAARTLFVGQDSDSGVSTTLMKAAGSSGFIAVRNVSFDHREYRLLSLDGTSRALALPPVATILGVHAGKLLIRPDTDWATESGLVVPAGSLAAIDLNALMNEAKIAGAEVIYRPSGDDAIRGADSYDGRLFVELLHDYATRLVELTSRPAVGWTARVIPLPAGRYIQVMDFAQGRLLLHEQGPLLSNRILLVDAQSGEEQRPLYQEPEYFDTSGLLTEYDQARSADGTLISYSVTRRPDLPFKQCAATLVYGYGGFDVALTPRYEPLFGKLWLEQGGVYVHAYLRGGGERAPTWHLGVMHAERHLAYDDMAAVLTDLHARGISQASHTGIIGRSNGGLMTAAVMERHPTLMNAVVIGGPLTDMLDFVNFPPGSAWTAEYGDPRDGEARKYIAGYSPMQNVASREVRYPEALIITSSDDDRVHPGHARRLSAVLEAKGHENLYFEDAQGGHYWELAGGPAPGDWHLRATARAVEFSYLWRQLGQDSCR
jgi:prolyl oligopeptidase